MTEGKWYSFKNTNRNSNKRDKQNARINGKHIFLNV